MAGEVKDLAWKRKDVTGKLKDLAENGKIDGKTEKFGGKSEDLAGKLKIWLENWKIRRENLRFGGKTERFVGNTLDLAEKLKKRPISSALCTLQTICLDSNHSVMMTTALKLQSYHQPTLQGFGWFDRLKTNSSWLYRIYALKWS